FRDGRIAEYPDGRRAGRNSRGCRDQEGAAWAREPLPPDLRGSVGLRKRNLVTIGALRAAHPLARKLSAGPLSALGALGRRRARRLAGAGLSACLSLAGHNKPFVTCLTEFCRGRSTIPPSRTGPAR